MVNWEENYAMATELHNVDVDLTSLVEILGDHLYSSPTVALREIIQNAHDAITRRQIETGGDFMPRIHLRVKASKGEIAIEDNGAGLTQEEIVQYVATIGNGYTRKLRGASGDDDLIGFFGLGFLTAHVISKRLILQTTSYQSPSQGWRFTGQGPAHFGLSDAPPRPVGTLLTLVLTEEFQDLAVPEIVRDLVAHYCRLLPVPVFVNDDQEPVNALQPPWSFKHRALPPVRYQKLCLEYAALFETRFNPIAVIPIVAQENDEIAGLIWIQGGSSYGSSDNRNVNVFVRGMFITDDARDLLPHWAGFAGAVIASRRLLPTLSREELQRNKAYQAVADHLRQTLIQGLLDMAESQPHTFRQVLRRHNEALLGAALDDDRLFFVLVGHLKVPTSEGEMTLAKVRERSGGRLVVSLGEKSGFEEILFRTQMTPVIHGYRFAVLPFCRKYCDTHPGSLHVIGTDEGNDRIFPETPLDDAQAALVDDLWGHLPYTRVATRFAPDYIPLALIPDRAYALKQCLESDAADRRITQGALHLARLYTDTLENDAPARMYINLDSPLIQQILWNNGNGRRAAAGILSAFVQIMSSHQSTVLSIDFASEFKRLNQQIMQLLKPEGGR